MRSYREVMSCVIVILFFAVGAACCVPIHDGAPGTIGACLAQPDGTTITLPAEQVMRIGRSGKSFDIKEWFEKQPVRPRLIVVSRQPLTVKGFWTVDVTGVLDTVPSASKDGSSVTQRVLIVSPENVTVYCDPRGKPIMFLPIKGQDTAWTNKRTLVQLSVLSATAAGRVSVMDESEFPPMPDELDSPTPPPAVGSRDSLKWLPDGSPVDVNGVLISAMGIGFFYVEKTDRSFGIRINSNESVWPGYLVNISGYMTTTGGERAIDADLVTFDEQYILYPRVAAVGLPNKAVGGGAVGSYTPAVADAVGMNNTGILVRTWGKVTFVDEVNGLFYLDDGSGVAADGGHVGIKVYNTSYDPIPTQDTYYVVTGASGAEIPSGSTSSIRVLYNVWEEASALLPGTGTVTGTITATGANGKTVRVCSVSSSTTATFSGNTASYTLTVHAGSGAVTASMIGYQTMTQLVTVYDGETATGDFTLAAIAKTLEVTPAQGRIAPDGVSETTIMAIVRDMEGRRIADQAVAWVVDVGTVVSSDSTTNAVGEAKLVLRSTSTPGTANVSVTAAGMSVIKYVEFASPTAPSVRILTPTLNQAASGIITIKVLAEDTAGTDPGIVNIGVMLDDQPLMPLSVGTTEGEWETYRIPNGVHHIKAAATDLDAECGLSQMVTVNVNNLAYSVAESTAIIKPGNPSSTITATLTTSSSWIVDITHASDTSLVRSYNGSGTTVSATWDGKATGGTDVPSGTYNYSIKSAGTSYANGIICVWRVTGKPVALLVEGFRFPYNAAEMDEAAKQCFNRGFDVITLPVQNATWQNFVDAFYTYPVQALFVTSHGQYEIRNNECVPTTVPEVTAFLLQGAWVYSHRPQKSDGTYYNEYPAPGEHAFVHLQEQYLPPGWPELHAHYISEIPSNLLSKITFAWMDACFCGRIGADRGDSVSQENPFAISGINDMAASLQIYNNQYTLGACYAGYYEKALSDAHYAEQVKVIFDSLGYGYNIGQAVWRDAYEYNNRYLVSKYIPYRENYGPCGIWRQWMPPYPNLRLHGNPWAFTLHPHY